MFMTHQKRSALALPPVLPALDLAGSWSALAEAALRLATAGESRHDIWNAFSTGRISKYGHPERHALAQISVSREPLTGLDPAATRLDLPGLGEIHAGFVDDKGEVHALATCKGWSGFRDVEGVIAIDSLGNPWFQGRDLDRNGQEFTSRILPDLLPLLQLASTETSILGNLPAAGRFQISAQGFVWSAVDGWARPKADDPDLARLQVHMAAFVARQEHLSAIIERVLTDEALEALVLGRDFPILGGISPAYENHKLRPGFDDAVEKISRKFMEALRAEGFLKRCPNNGPRDVRGITSWNDWLDGRLDNLGAKSNDRFAWSERLLPAAPAFRLIESSVFAADFDTQDATRERLKPGSKLEARNFDEKIPVDREDFDVFKHTLRASLLESFVADRDLRARLISGSDLQDKLTGNRLQLEGSILAPVLCARARPGEKPVPLPSVDVPKVARHLEMTLPSGVLVMADWLRIPGFTEAVRSLCQGDDFDLASAAGFDARAKSYFETLGLAIVQVGNSSPAAFADTPGVWRMGYVDEDHKAFWTADGQRTKLALPEPAWKTCTDLWANIFADREVILDILMASGKYDDREAAGAALQDYADTTYGVSIVDLGVEKLHLYLPTGAAEMNDRFPKEFRAAGLKTPKWREDLYVLSATPLTVDPDLLEDCAWVEGQIEAAKAGRDQAPENENDPAP